MMKRDNQYSHIDELILSYSKGKTTVGEEQELLDWIAQSSENRAYFKESLAFCRHLSSVSKISRNRLVQPSFGRSKIIRMPIAAFMVVAVTLLIFFIWSLGVNRDVTLKGHNPISEFMLEDGSKVWLTGNSVMKKTKKFAKESRNVWLKGTAYFVIAKDSKRPFIIDVNGVAVRVVGTRFLIESRKDSSGTVISVFEGKVEVSSLLNKPVMLVKNDMLQVSKIDGSIRFSEEKRAKTVKGTSGEDEFTNVKLEDAARMFSRYFGIPFFVVDKDIAEVRITTKINNQSLEEIEFVLEQALGLKVTKENEVILISKK